MNNRRLNCTCDLIKQLNVTKDIYIDIEIDGWCTYPKYLKDREIKWIDKAEVKNCQLDYTGYIYGQRPAKVK